MGWGNSKEGGARKGKGEANYTVTEPTRVRRKKRFTEQRKVKTQRQKVDRII